ncbi:universal stress protein [Gramella jeungdoensis]|uniref:Universal stress protein n=1 Tax=Gramella jeungdoensis TaxID=708091 RepID=A0ABT0Z0Q5_9FLAO|nr:universal stress protein [Gramella jeungdoensis]MCM8569297.1 universal stress protein [Gramella jeungdoensis]
MNVLILTDFSEVSDNAGRYAVDFLQKIPANFFILNIHDFNFSKSASRTLENELVSTLEKLQKSVRDLENYTKNPEHSFNTILSSDNLINAVRKALTEKKIDLIFIGAASQAVHHHPILGDHAYEVIRKIRCNIMAVPGDSSYAEAEKFVLPVDYSVISREKVFSQLEQADFINQGRLTVIELDEDHHESTTNEFAWPKLAKVNGKAKTRYVKMGESQIFSEDLLKEIQGRFDMIVIIGKNLSVCDHFLHARYGLLSTLSNSLPILVIHECK